MKTDLFYISAEPKIIAGVLDEVERAAVYCRLNEKSVNIMRLLAEESVAMTMDVLTKSEGTLWIESSTNMFEIHLSVDTPVTPKAREEFIAVSTAKKNTPPKGLKAKISNLFSGLFSSNLTGENLNELYANMACGFMGGVYIPICVPSAVWSMSAYNQNAPKEVREDELQGIEKSIIECFADDVLVTVTTNGVAMVVKKVF